MINTNPSVVVLLTTKYHNRLLVAGLDGPEPQEVLVTCDGAFVVASCADITRVHCIETNEDLLLDGEYAIFRTAEPDEFVARFVPMLREAVARLGWPHVQESLRDLLGSGGSNWSNWEPS